MQTEKSSNPELAVRTVDVSDLAKKADEIVREVQETGRPVDISLADHVVARLSPVESTASDQSTTVRWTDEDRAEFWRNWDEITKEISRVSPTGISAVDAVREQRRDL